MSLTLNLLRVQPESLQFQSSLVTPGLPAPAVERPAAAPAAEPEYQIVRTIEVPFRAGQADTITLNAGFTVWLDDPAVNRKLKRRRAVTLINEDTINPLRWGFSEGAAFRGAILHAGQSLSFPALALVNIYAQATVIAGSNISLVQWA
jgi:hypothetical protein